MHLKHLKVVSKIKDNVKSKQDESEQFQACSTILTSALLWFRVTVVISQIVIKSKTMLPSVM